MQCTATSKRSGVQCKRHATPGMTVCKFHGGKSWVGVASPTFKHGRYSKHLPTRLLDRYNESRADPNLLHLAEEVALCDIRLTELLNRAEVGDGVARWQASQMKHSELNKAIRAGDGPGLIAAARALGEIVNAGATDGVLWQDVLHVMEQRRKLVESEHKRMASMQQLVSVDQVMTLISTLTAIMRKYITDRKVLSAIGREFEQQLGREYAG